MDNDSVCMGVAIVGGLFALGGPALDWLLQAKDRAAGVRRFLPVAAYLGVVATLFVGIVYLSYGVTPFVPVPQPRSASDIAREEAMKGVDTSGVVLLEGEKPAKFLVGDHIRVRAPTPPGGNSVSAKTEGPIRLVADRGFMKLVDGRPMLGEKAEEFEFRAEEIGDAKITLIYVDGRSQKVQSTKEHRLEIIRN